MARSTSSSLVVIAEGLGNAIMAGPLVETLAARGLVDVWWAFGAFRTHFKLFAKARRWLLEPPRERYDVAYFTPHARQVRVACSVQRRSAAPSANASEVAASLALAPEPRVWNVELEYTPSTEHFPYVLCNGGHPAWERKRWPRWRELAARLEGAASVGLPHEHVAGTRNLTRLPLEAQLGAIANAGVFISNDTGLFHAACALKVPTVVVFTATSLVKNVDERFHAARVVTRGLPCQPCQGTARWHSCEKWECRDVSVEDVLRAIHETKL